MRGQTKTFRKVLPSSSAIGVTAVNANKVWASVGESLPSLFEFLPGVSEGFKVRTPFLYPDGGLVDVFVLECEEGFTVTDFGDALGWRWPHSLSIPGNPLDSSC